MKRRLLLIPAVLITAPLLFTVWLISSDSGTQWLFTRSLPLLPEQLKIDAVSGPLLGPVKVTGVHYHNDNFDVDIDDIEIDWEPSALLLGKIHVNSLRLSNSRVNLAGHTTETAEATESTPIPAAASTIHLPLPVIVDKATADSIRITSSTRSSPVEFTNTVLQIDANREQLTIRSFSSNHGQQQLRLSGALLGREYLPMDINVDFRHTLADGRTISSHGRIYGDLQELHARQTVTGPVQGQFTATLTDLMTDLHWQLQMETPDVQLSKLAPSWPGIETRLKATASGDLQNYQFRLGSHFSGEQIPAGRLDLSGNGDRRQLKLERIALTIPGGRIQGHAVLQHNADMNWTIALQGRDFDIGSVIPELKNTPISFATTGQGRINLAAVRGDQNLNTRPWYSFQLRTDVSAKRIPTTRLQLSGSGNRDRLELPNLSLNLPQDGQITGHAEVTRITKGLAWKLSLAGENINPGVVQPEWTGQIGFSATSSGTIGDKRVDGLIDITDANGILRGYPLALQTNIIIESSQLTIKRLQLDSGRSHVQINGQAGRQLALEWEILSPDLQELHPQARGLLQASGQIEGPIAQPEIRFSAQGQDLGWRDYHLRTLAANGALDLFSWQTPRLRIQAQDLTSPSQHLDDLELRLAGNGSANHLDLVAVNDTSRIAIQLEGRYRDRQWQGQVLEATLLSAHYGDWLLESAADVQFTPTRIDSQPLCWKSSQGRLCLDPERRQQHWRASVDAEALSMAPFNLLLPDNLRLQGRLSGKASLDYLADTSMRARAELELTAGSLSYPLIEGERDTWHYDRGQMNLRLDKNGLTASMSVDVNEDHWQLAATLPGLDPMSPKGGKQALHGKVRINISDLGLIEAFIPEMQDLQGKLVSIVNISGTLAQPEIDGTLQLQQGRFRVPRLGLELEDLIVSIQSHGLNRFSYQAGVKSRQGMLQVNGDTEFSSPEDWSSTLTLKGTDFEFINIPEARVSASPDLQVTIKPYTVKIEGSIHIPKARLQPKDLSRATPISTDVSIRRAGTSETEQKWQISSRIRLTLGERVTWYGLGFEGRFSGNVLLVDQPDQPTLATGELTIDEGRYQAYGQKLTIEQGQVIYSGGPLNNPGLNLRAARYIGEITAGVRVSGTLQAPQAELYSVPAMGQTDTLAYLVLGRPVEQASGNDGSMMAGAALALGLSGGDLLARKIGDRFDLDEMRIASSDSGDQAELIIGRYLNPRLYLSYGIGLIESVNTVIIRYQLSQHWQFKAESGLEQGADMLYVIER